MIILSLVFAIVYRILGHFRATEGGIGDLLRQPVRTAAAIDGAPKSIPMTARWILMARSR